MNKNEFIEQVTSYLDTTLRRKGVTLKLTPETELFATGAIDSLAFAQFVDFLEGELGAEIPDEKLSVEFFLTLNMVWENFGAGEASETATQKPRREAPAESLANGRP